MVVRSYRPGDLDAVAAMWHASKRAAFSYVAVQQAHTLDDDRAYLRDALAVESAIWVAESDGAVVGFMAIKGMPAVASDLPLVDQLFVAVDRQRRGIGDTLLGLAKQFAPSGLRLFTFQRNAPARDFYEQRGFVAVRFGVSAAPENEPDVEYHWRP